MNTQEQLLYMIQYLIHEDTKYSNLEIPDSIAEQKKLLRSLMNIRPPRPVHEEFLEVQDSYLGSELKLKRPVTQAELSPVQNGIYLWQGDITRLQADAVVNAANSALLGCFIPCHGCIDNAIHSSVGPVIHGEPDTEDCAALASCYRSCMEFAAAYRLDSIAFCCISTGEFHFPNETAARIAVETVKKYLQENNSETEVIFNVYKDRDYEIYRHILSGTLSI